MNRFSCNDHQSIQNSQFMWGRLDLNPKFLSTICVPEINDFSLQIFVQNFDPLKKPQFHTAEQKAHLFVPCSENMSQIDAQLDPGG